MCALCLYPASPSWGVPCGCVCLGSRFGCAPPLLAGVLGCVCVSVRALLVPRHSWLGCAVWVCVLGLGFWLRPATPGWGVGVCVCLCALSACIPHLLAGPCGVRVCALAWLLAARRHSWLGCCGVCGFVRALRLYPATPGCRVSVRYCLARVPAPWFVRVSARCPGLWHPVAVVAWHLSVCLHCGRPRASLTCLPAPLWCAAPCLLRSLSALRSSFPTPGCLSSTRGLAPPDLLCGCAGHVEAGREPGFFCLPLAAAEAAAVASLRVVCVCGPAMGLSQEGPSGVGLGLRALRWFACVGPVTNASGFPYRPSFDGGLGRCTGAVSCGSQHRPFRVGEHHARNPCVCACACPSWLGRAGQPPGRVLVCLIVSCGRSQCSVCLLGPLRAGVALLVVVAVVSFFFRPRCLLRSVFSAAGRLGPWRLVPPPSFFFSPPPAPYAVFFSCLSLVFSVFFGVLFPFLFLPWCAGCAVPGVVLRRGQVCACAVLFAAPRLCPLSVCCYLFCCACPVAPCWRRFSSPCCPWCLLVWFVLWSCSAAVLAACRCPWVLW